jgi:hypothetical protein
MSSMSVSTARQLDLLVVLAIAVRDGYFAERSIWGLGSCHRKVLRLSSSCANFSRPGRRPRLVRRERRCDSAAGRNADVVFAATLCAELRTHMDARVFATRAHAADSQGLAKASSHISGTAAVHLATDPLDSGATGRREPASPVALVGASLGHQALPMLAWRRSTGPSSSAPVLLTPAPRIDDCRSKRFYRRDAPKLLTDS